MTENDNKKFSLLSYLKCNSTKNRKFYFVVIPQYNDVKQSYFKSIEFYEDTMFMEAKDGDFALKRFTNYSGLLNNWPLYSNITF